MAARVRTGIHFVRRGVATRAGTRGGEGARSRLSVCLRPGSRQGSASHQVSSSRRYRSSISGSRGSTSASLDGTGCLLNSSSRREMNPRRCMQTAAAAASTSRFTPSAASWPARSYSPTPRVGSSTRGLARGGDQSRGLTSLRWAAAVRAEAAAAQASPLLLEQPGRRRVTGSLLRHMSKTSTEGEGDEKEKEGGEDGAAGGEGSSEVAKMEKMKEKAHEEVPPVPEEMETEEEPPHHHLRLPEITHDTHFGDVAQWLVEEGQHISIGDHLVELDYDMFSIQLDAEEAGYVAKIHVAGKEKDIPVGTALATIVPNEEDMQYFNPVQEEEEEKQKGDGEGEEETPLIDKEDRKGAMRAISKLLKDGALSEIAANDLLKLARQSDTEFYNAYDGCFDGNVYKEEDFDFTIFKLQVTELLEDRKISKEEEEEKEKEKEEKA